MSILAKLSVFCVIIYLILRFTMENELTLDVLRTWKVAALKDFLRPRDLKVTGTKDELVARVFAAHEQNYPVAEDSSERLAKSKLEFERLLATLDNVLPDPLSLKDGWIGEIEGMKQWPQILLSDIALYIMKDHPGNDVTLQKRLLNEYKEGKAYRLYEQGWLKEIQINLVNDNSKYCFLKAKCTPSMKINDTPHTLWICSTKRTGDIHSAYCSCTAG